MEGFVDVGCPYCNEPITVRVDVTAGSQSYIEDCQVCCQPIAMAVLVNDNGQLREVLAERLD
ncbi:MAG: CPXCG motif-containing cysteine-rich protein [Steroidobacteraceae bacterium]